MGINDYVAGITVKRVTDLQEKNREERVHARARGRGSARESHNNSGDQASFSFSESGQSTLEEADRMLQEIKDMVQMAARRDRNAARRASSEPEAGEMTDATIFLFPPEEVGGQPDPEEDRATTVAAGHRGLPHRSYTDVQTIYGRHPVKPVSEVSSGKTAETVGKGGQAGPADDEGREAPKKVLDLTI